MSQQHMRKTLQWKRRWIRGTGCFFYVAIPLACILGYIYLPSKILLVVFLVLFIFIGGILYSQFSSRVKKQEDEWLQNHGITVQAVIIRIKERTFSRGSQPLNAIRQKNSYLKLTWTSPQGQVYRFRQELSGSRSSNPQYAIGGLVNVSIDPDNPSLYRILPLDIPILHQPGEEEQ